jgi:hypothetical protein
MPDDRTQCNPLLEIDQESGAVHPERMPARNLIYDIAPAVDQIRQIATDLGTRPYRVFLVHIVWTGTRRGDGQPSEIARIEILPTPKVSSSTSFAMQAMGLTEMGGISVSQISLRFTEDDLTGKTPDLIDPAMTRTGLRNAEFFYEVVERRPTGPTPIPRRYIPADVPTRGNTGWRVNLLKQGEDRARGQTFNRTSA